MANTATRANISTILLTGQKAKSITFKDKEHEKFYYLYLSKCRIQDVYHQALIYCLGISADTRNNIKQIFNIKTDCINTDCLREGWITSGSAKVVRLAFNLYHELYELICEIVCVKHEAVRISGEIYPYELVKERFLMLNSSHLLYVIECMQNTTVKINNVKSYMITALYNAPSTMKHYYQQEVNHDMYGGGWEEKGIT